MSLFPTEAEQIQTIEEADDPTVAASFLMEKAADVMLRLGGNSEEIRKELAFDYRIGKSADEIAAHMRALYQAVTALKSTDGGFRRGMRKMGFASRSGAARGMPTQPASFRGQTRRSASGR